jgi:nucleotide-binding universal stress UspA family protein
MVTEFKKIVIPIDGSAEAKKAAQKALVLAKHLDVPATALYVIDTSLLARFPAPEDVTAFNIDKFLQKEGLNALDAIEAIGKGMDVPVDKKMVEGIPDQEIIRAAHKNDLIVMGSQGMSALDRILIGSVSEKVLHHAPCPVMIVRG